MRPLALILGIALVGFVGLPVGADDAPSNERQALFDNLDTDGNGQLSPAEIPEAQSRFFQRLVRVGDDNGDGELTREEFLNATEEPEAPVAEPQRRGPDAGNQRGRAPMQVIPIDQLFDRYDANGDDKLTLSEIPEDMRPRLERLFGDNDEITREQLTRMRDQFFGSAGVVGLLRRLDENGNGDGKIDLSEVPEPFRPRLQPVFDRFGGGELDVQRVAEAMQQSDRRRPNPDNTDSPRPEQPPQGRPGRDGAGPPLMQVLDTDGDRQISRDELEAAAEKFDELDRNGDGQIDAPELFGFPRDGIRPDIQRPEGRPGQRPARPDGASDRPRRPEGANDNTSTARSRPDGNAAPVREAAASGKALLSQFDRDGDDALSEQEVPEFLKSRFNRLDGDGDGLLAGDELRSIRGGFRPRTDRNPE